MNKQNKKGFTLIEILVVISIIGFIAASAMYALNNARVKARDAKRLSDIKILQKALEMYYDDNNLYPGGSNGWYYNDACDATGFAGKISSIPSLSLFLSKVPDDPNNNIMANWGCYWYNRLKNGQGYKLLIYPENRKLMKQDMNCECAGFPSCDDLNDYYCIGENW